jgi:hypothetical protein
LSIFRRLKASSISRHAAYAGAAFALSSVGLMAAAIVALPSAYADTLGVGGCVGAVGQFNCVVRVGPAGDPYVRTVPEPDSQAEKERSAERDRRWIDRCRPVVAQDRYGVPRYHYAAPGCEFGVIE